MKTCQTIVGISPVDDSPMHCGEPGVEIGEITRCRKHWDRVRERANRCRKRSPQESLRDR